MQILHRDLLLGRDCHDLLREDVERITRNHGLLDQPLLHPLCDHGRLQEICAKLRKDPALRNGAELVARAPDALQSARDRLRRLHLDDKIDSAHVDPELERGRGDEARDLPGLQQLLDLQPLLASERAVVRARDLSLGQFVQAQCEPFG